MKFSIFFLACAMMFSLNARADAASDLANAKCTKCHNPNASSARIDGQTPEYLFQSTMDYKTKKRTHMMMYKLVAGLDEASIRSLAEYFSKLAPGKGIAGDAAKIAMGKELYNNPNLTAGVRSCADCHGTNGEGRGFGNGMNARLAGQYSNFAIKQLGLYRDGSLKDEEMNAALAKLTDPQIEALAEYLQSLN